MKCPKCECQWDLRTVDGGHHISCGACGFEGEYKDFDEPTTAEKLYSLVQNANKNASFLNYVGYQSIIVRFICGNFGYVRVGKETYRINECQSLDEAIIKAYEWARKEVMK